MAQTLPKLTEDCTAFHEKEKGTEIGPFGLSAMELWEAGLAVIPCGGDDGKVPLVEWRKWTSRPGRGFMEKMVRRFAGANIGVLTGLSRVTVVDTDGGRELVTTMTERCGPTPLQTSTPSGGAHLWFRSSGERSMNLRAEGLAVDVKGIGGFVVVPPSIRPNGPHAGKAYGFVSGSWADLRTLPTIRPGALSNRNISPLHRGGGDQAGGGDVVHLRAVKEGNRNQTMYRRLLRQVRHCDAIEDLMDVADTLNANFDPPLPVAELARIVTSVWRMEIEGRNWAGTEAKVYVTDTECKVLTGHKHGSDGALLLMKLRFAHWDRPNFAASPDGMAKAQIIPGWAHGRYRNALVALIETGILTVAHEGGRGTRDPRLFAFTAPGLVKGMESGGNITKHPPPLPLIPCQGPAAAADRLHSECWPTNPHAVPSPGADTITSGTDTPSNPVGAASPKVPVVDDGQFDLIEFSGGPPAPRRVDPCAFGAALREIRIRLNLTQKAAAQMAGLSRSGFGNIETGEYSPSPETVVRLAEVFGMRLAS